MSSARDLRVKVTVFGSGYVGLVTGACFAEAGNHVVCVDIDAGKVARLQQGEIPIHEPGLDDWSAATSDKGRLRFTTAPKRASPTACSSSSPSARRRRRTARPTSRTCWQWPRPSAGT
jgi:UDP-N-acetyl-D-mannosaminuronate dehydrogenase